MNHRERDTFEILTERIQLTAIETKRAQQLKVLWLTSSLWHLTLKPGLGNGDGLIE
jgi:hypothetical protein